MCQLAEKNTSGIPLSGTRCISAATTVFSYLQLTVLVYAGSPT